MMAGRKVIDLEDIAGGDALADELERHPEGVVLRRGGRDFATVLHDPDAVDKVGHEVERPSIGWRERLEGLTPDSVLATIPVHGPNDGPFVSRPMTPERLERILRIIGPRDDLAAEDMHRRVEENRRESIRRRTTERLDQSEG